MKIALVQQKATGDREANRRRGLEAVREAASRGAEVVCFSELGLDPFFPQDRRAAANRLALAETVPGPTTRRFAELAAELERVLVLNLFERDGDRTYDTSPVIDSTGKILGTTRMVHIADFENFRERSYYAPGDRGAPVYDTRFGRIGVAICYDRHYPEYLRALALAGAQVVFIPQANTGGEFPEGLYLDLDRIARSPARRWFLRDRRPELYGPWLAAEHVASNHAAPTPVTPTPVTPKRDTP